MSLYTRLEDYHVCYTCVASRNIRSVKKVLTGIGKTKYGSHCKHVSNITCSSVKCRHVQLVFTILYIHTYSKRCSQFQKTFTNIDWSQNSVQNIYKQSQNSVHATAKTKLVVLTTLQLQLKKQ